MMNDWGLAARFLVALAIVLALIAAATWFARRYLASGFIGNLGGRRRLSIVEYAMLDGKSRLVLVRRDDTEHLLVLGPTGAVVVESGVRNSGGGAATASEAGVAPTTGSSRDTPRPPLRSLITGRQ